MTMKQIFAFFDGNDELISIAVNAQAAMYEEMRCSDLHSDLYVISVIAPTKDECWAALLADLVDDDGTPVIEIDDMEWEGSNVHFH